jgi:hypothetical protein
MLFPYNNLILCRYTYKIELKKASLNLLKILLFQILKQNLLFTNLSILIFTFNDFDNKGFRVLIRYYLNPTKKGSLCSLFTFGKQVDPAS